jgi:hypothetical protein
MNAGGSVGYVCGAAACRPCGTCSMGTSSRTRVSIDNFSDFEVFEIFAASLGAHGSCGGVRLARPAQFPPVAACISSTANSWQPRMPLRAPRTRQTAGIRSVLGIQPNSVRRLIGCGPMSQPYGPLLPGLPAHHPPNDRADSPSRDWSLSLTSCCLALMANRSLPARCTSSLFR